MSKGKTYDEDFKKMIVELYNNKKPASEIVREYGISSSVLYKWIKEYSPIETEDGTVTNNKEIQKLKKEMNKIKEQNVIEFYLVCNKLKTVIRTGWKNWHVKKERLESVAEHIFGVQMLAIAMYSEYQYNIDIKKVIYMLAIHELGEAVIGDLTQFEITKEEKEKIEHEAVHKILNNLLNGEQIEQLFLEFDERKTKEALFAYQCDKLECDLQCKLYDEENCVDLNNQKDNISLNNPIVKKLLEDGASWSTMWLKFGQQIYNYDDNFKAVSNYLIENKINEESNK